MRRRSARPVAGELRELHKHSARPAGVHDDACAGVARERNARRARDAVQHLVRGDAREREARGDARLGRDEGRARRVLDALDEPRRQHDELGRAAVHRHRKHAVADGEGRGAGAHGRDHRRALS